ncbi:MAG: DNA helicase, partial [Clostridiales bacterium]
IYHQYQQNNKKIRPLVLIQFPNARPDTIEKVEQKLESMGYTYQNGMVAKWISEEKINIEEITENSGTPVFLLMKQAITTGWDCPRAKILVKLREGMSETFEVQTIGRIRRMPEAIHYEDDLLDFCFVYTFDEKYKAGLLENIDKSYETRRLFLKPRCKTFTLEKQLRNLDYEGIGEREVLDKVYDFFKKKYALGENKQKNKTILESKGYIFGDEVLSHIIQGKFIKTESVMENSAHHITTRKKVNTHKHGIEMLHAIDSIKKTIGMQNRAVKTILERLFRKDLSRKHKLLLLSTSEFYAFLINNEHKLKEDFSDITTDMAMQHSLFIEPKTATFKIPEQDFFKYDVGVKNETEYSTNAYEHYTSGYTTSLVRSQSELLFEMHCESRDDIEWVYKNGDTGQQYFSIVYIDALRKQWLFYADYIVKKSDGTIWVIETKGGESRGQSKNIDKQIINKFNAFKDYAETQNIHWGFVRDKDNLLYINNTEYVEEMSDDNWVLLTDKF